MANLTGQATFEYTVFNNKRVYYATITSAGQTTADLIVFPLQVITGVEFAGFTGAPGAGALIPVLQISGTTVNITNYSTGFGFILKAEGR